MKNHPVFRDNSERLMVLPDGRTVAIEEDGGYRFEPLESGAPRENPDCVGAYWELAGATAAMGSIEIVGVGAPTGVVKFILQQQQLVIEKPGALRLVLTDDYLRPEAVAASDVHANCLLAKPVGRTLWIGPLFRNGDGACAACLRWWLTLNRYPQNSLVMAGAPFAPDHAVARTPATEAMAAGWIATIVALLAAGVEQPELLTGILHFDTVSQQLSRSVLISRQECPHCGAKGTKPAALRHFEGKYCGLVRNLETGRALGHSVAKGVCVQSYPRNRQTILVEPQMVGGKGLTLEEAKDSCIGEALERYALVYQGNESLVTGSKESIGGLAPNALLCYSDRQVETRSESVEDSEWVAPKFDEKKAVPWVNARSLTDGGSVLVLAEYCYFWTPWGIKERNCIADSNGCACGRDLTSAQLSGLYELIERDAVSLWWYNRVQRPALDPNCLDDSRLRQTISCCDSEGWDVELLDVTTEFRVPVFVATARHRKSGWFAIGTAAHVDPAEAATKALSEAALVEFASRSAGRSSKLSRWLAGVLPDSHPQIKPRGRTVLSRRPLPVTREEQLESALAELKNNGIATYWVDLTRPETSWPVVRVIAPGLRHFQPRFGPGRLYDGPVKLGWLEGRRKEEELETTAFAI